MIRDRLIQATCLGLALASAAGAGTLLPRLLRLSEENTLRYTDVALEGAPPIVQLGTAIGALRGIIVDYLWIKVNAQKQKGLFYEIMADSKLITELQPRFAAVWAFHGHNMAYNISVLTNTPEERWEWVNAGIRLVREEGLRYNPNDVVLHKELAFWFAHKIDGVADNAHLYYKRQFAREWHLLLGPPPPNHAERAAWIKEIADAPDTIEEAINGREALGAPTALVNELVSEISFASEQAKTNEKRHLSRKEVAEIAQRIIDAAAPPTVIANELKRIAAIAEDGDDAASHLHAIEAAGGELLPAIQPQPKVGELIETLKEKLKEFDKRVQYRPDRQFVQNYGVWEAMKWSPYAQLLGIGEQQLANNPVYRAFGAIGDDPQFADAWKALLAHLRRRVLIDELNMDPRLMYEYTRDLRPLDWRHPQSHALYFARRGSQFGTKRYDNPDEVYKVLNNERLQIQAMQALARSGLMRVDPFSDDNPGRLVDVRWIKVYDGYLRVLYDRFYKTRGAGPDTFTHGHENFMSDAVRQLYRAGDVEGAQRMLDGLDTMYGRTGLTGAPPSLRYARPLDIFVQETTFGEYDQQPDVARGDVYAALERGFREGLLMNKPERLEQAIKFARQVTDFFKNNKNTDFVTKFGEARLGALLGDLETSVTDVFGQTLVDGSLPLFDRLIIYGRAPEPLRRAVYDRVKPLIQAEFERNEMGKVMNFAAAYPEPPGMEEYRAQQAAEAARREEQPKEGGRGDFLRR